MKFLDLAAAAVRVGASARDCGNGHWQVIGNVTVNWWPHSRRQRYFIDGASHAHGNTSSIDVIVRASMQGPPRLRMEPRMSAERARRERARLLRKDAACHWCRCSLTSETATIDHVLPLARGGTNRRENLAIACEPCNRDRGHEVGAPAGGVA